MAEKGLVQIIEGALLAAGKPLSLSQLAELFEEHERPDTAALKDALEEVAARCEGRGYELKEVASGFRFQVRQNLSPWVARLWQERPQKYSRALLETLALIAYRQPITRGEIEEIRGVAVSSNIIKTLHEREWIRVVGHRDVPGRPAMYATTRQFLDYFNLKNLDQLPALAEIRDLETLTAELGFDTAMAGGPTPSDDGSPEASAHGLTVVGGTEHRPVAAVPAEATGQAGAAGSPAAPADAPEERQPDAVTGAAGAQVTEAPEQGGDTPLSDSGPDVEAARPETQA